MVAQNIAFGVLSAAMVLAALRLVTTRNIVRAALFLVVVLAGAAGQFILLASEFVAVVQVLVYVGAIVVLFLFGIMLTRAPIGEAADLDNNQRGVALIVALFLAGTLGAVILDAFRFEDATKLRLDGVAPTSSAAIADSIFSQYVIPFEVISVLLTAALVGAIVIARRD
jgi:NADH-quinone oxidoreductase subunit J